MWNHKNESKGRKAMNRRPLIGKPNGPLPFRLLESPPFLTLPFLFRDEHT